MDDRHERRFFGVDPGLTRTGLGVLSTKSEGLFYLGSQLIEPPPNQALCDRLHQLHAGARQFLCDWDPEVMVVENLIYARNAQVALKLGQARGVLLLAAAEHGIPVIEYAPREIKLAVTGYGTASKEQVQRMVQAVLNISDLSISYDVADALALAICHAHRHGGRPPKEWNAKRKNAAFRALVAQSHPEVAGL